MIHRSPACAPVVPDITFDRFALAAGERCAARPALIDAASGRSVSHGELARDVERLGAALVSRGVQPGDGVAVCLPNLPEQALVVLGAMRAGAAVVPVNPLLQPRELARQLTDSGARWLFALPALIDASRPALEACGLRELFSIGEAAGATPFGRLLAHGGSATPRTIDSREALALLPYSSGTTGTPKGVMLTHRGLVANALQISQWLVTADERTVALGTPPMFHVFGAVLYYGALLARGATVLTLARFDLEAFLAAIEKYRVDYVAVTQPVARALAESPLVERFDLSSLRRVTCGAAALGAPLAAALEHRLGVSVLESYGMTEVCGASHAQRPGEGHAGAVALPGMEWRIVDLETAIDVGPGVEGELLLRGPTTMKGYLNRPAETAASLDQAGWLRTGDLGYADAHDRLVVTGRLKDLIKVAGYQVAPAELEALLLEHPQVADAAVVGVPDRDGWEMPVAYVVRRGEVDAAALAGYVAERVAPFKRLRDIVFLERLPRSHTGKLLRRELPPRGAR